MKRHNSEGWECIVLSTSDVKGVGKVSRVRWVTGPLAGKIGRVPVTFLK